MLANAQRSPLLQEIGNPTSRKLYSSANNLIDDHTADGCGASDYEMSRITKNDLARGSSASRIRVAYKDTSFNDSDTYETTYETIRDSIRREKGNAKSHLSEELLNHNYLKASSSLSTSSSIVVVSDTPISTNIAKNTGKYTEPSPLIDHTTTTTTASSNFVHSVASTLVGTAKRVSNRKRDRSKSKEFKRRDSSESRLTSLADFFRSPSGSRKSSLASDRKNSAIAIKISDIDNIESSPENSMKKPVLHKSRSSKSPLRVLTKIRTWGSRDALDNKSSSVKIEYTVLENTISNPKLDSNDMMTCTPSFLTANSRKGIDFENLEADMCNLDSEHSNDSSKSKNSLIFFDELERNEPRSSLDSTRSKSSITSKQSERLSDHEFDFNESINEQSKINDFIRDMSEEEQCSNFNDCFNVRLTESLNKVVLSRQNSDSTSSASSVSSNILATEKFFKKN